MGTKHGYTEKRCDACGKMKKRSEYHIGGSRICNDCCNKKRRDEKESAKRWKNKTPEQRKAHAEENVRWRKRKKGQ